MQPDTRLGIGQLVARLAPQSVQSHSPQAVGSSRSSTWKINETKALTEVIRDYRLRQLVAVGLVALSLLAIADGPTHDPAPTADIVNIPKQYLVLTRCTRLADLL